MKGLSPYGAVWAGPRNYNFKWHQIQWEKLCFGVRGRLEMRCQICRLRGGGVKREEQALHVKGTREDGNSVNAQNVPWRGNRDVKCQVSVYNVSACVAGSRSFKDAQKSFKCCNIPLASKPVHFTVVSKVLVGFFCVFPEYSKSDLAHMEEITSQPHCRNTRTLGNRLFPPCLLASPVTSHLSACV